MRDPVQPRPGEEERAPRLLLVDDEVLVREVARRILTSAGFEVVLAENGPQALELLQQEGSAIDLVLLDVRLPGLSGPQVLVQLRQFAPDLPVLFTSGDLTGLGPELALVQGVIRKPFRLDELVSIIRGALQGGRGECPPSSSGQGSADSATRKPL